MTPQEISELSIDKLREILLTCDGKGIKVKELALAALISKSK